MSKTKYICSFCKKEFLRYKSTVRNEDAVFCSKECYINFQRKYDLNKGKSIGRNNQNVYLTLITLKKEFIMNRRIFRQSKEESL